jgi:DmsE family decaheme c-type cytochrome
MTTLRPLIAIPILILAAGIVAGQVSRDTQPPRVVSSSGPPEAAAHPAAPAAAGAGTVVKAEYIGQTGCTTGCHKHDTIWKNFSNNPHFKSVASGKEPPERTGCEGCHGAGKEHVDARGDLDTIVHDFASMKPPEIIGLCLTCHKKEFNRANIQRSEHTQHDVACTTCHSIHNPVTARNLLAKSQPEACYQCHSDVRAQFSLPSKHRVNEGFMSCSDCHNPHGGFTPRAGMGQTSKMLEQSHGNEQPCMKCHVDKRGPFVFEHQAGEVDGCTGCHSPHGSTNAKLLTKPTVTMLCLECHTGSGDFGDRSNRGVTYPDHATHSMTNPRYQRCTSCHVAIHGSNVHYRFLR